MKIAYALVPYFTPMLGAGITARLKAVQVIELVEGKQMNLFDKQDLSKVNPLGLSTDIFPEFIAVQI